MVTAVSTGGLDTGSQFGQLGSSVGALLSSVCEGTGAAFRRVHVQKKDADGNTLFYDHKDEAGVVTRKECVFTYIEDVKSGALFVDDSPGEVRAKCCAVAFGMLFYTAAKMTWHAVKTALVISSIAAEAFATVGKLFYHGKCNESAAAIKHGISCVSGTFRKGLYEVVKSPLFALGCTFTALYGVLKPYHGRKFEAMMENTWQNGASYTEDCRYVFSVPATSWQDFLQKMQKAPPFYLAWCFQVHGNISDARFTLLKREAV